MLRTVAELGFEQTTPIQTGAIPPALLGSDVIGQAHTGSGKTAAFGIPMVERLDPDSDTLQALVLCPTRELAVQVHDDLARLSAGRLRALAIYGGDSMSRQLDGLRQHPHIVVATPGRLRDHLQRRSISLGGIRIAVLDEADRMLDMGFAPDVEAILRECPKQRQTLLFSATMPDWVRRIAGRHMHEPVTDRGQHPARDPRGGPAALRPDQLGRQGGHPLPHPRPARCDHGAHLRGDQAHRRPPPGADRAARLHDRGAPRRPDPEGARRCDAAVRRHPRALADRHQRGGARPRHRRHQPRHQLRRAGHAGRLPPPGRPHRPGRDAAGSPSP